MCCVNGSRGQRCLALRIVGWAPGPGAIVRLIAGGLLAFGLGTGGAAPATAAIPRIGQAAAQAARTGWFASVACPTRALCLAVGYGGSGKDRALAERWNGRSWVLQRVPLPRGSATSYLSGVSCASARACVAVDGDNRGDGGHSLAERWNGRRWNLMRVPPPHWPYQKQEHALDLHDVACPTSRFCVAVGHYVVSESGRALALRETWNGRKWSARKPMPDGAPASGYDSVSCASRTMCMTVGEESPNLVDPAQSPFSQRFSGRRWSDPRRMPYDGSVSFFVSVACPTARFCLAVQGDNTVDVWNGSRWSLRLFAAPSLRGSAAMDAVSCSSPRACLAVGGGDRPLAERWNGKRWSVLARLRQAAHARLSDIACASPRSCMTVGGRSYPDTSVPFAEQWNGTRWLPQRVPTPSLTP